MENYWLLLICNGKKVKYGENIKDSRPHLQLYRAGLKQVGLYIGDSSKVSCPRTQEDTPLFIAHKQVAHHGSTSNSMENDPEYYIHSVTALSIEK